MTELSRQELNARRSIMRHYYGDGRWGEQAGMSPEIVKTRPDGIIWAQARPGATGQRSKFSHILKYTLYNKELKCTLSVWVCGGMSFSRVLIRAGRPSNACDKCQFWWDRRHS